MTERWARCRMRVVAALAVLGAVACPADKTAAYADALKASDLQSHLDSLGPGLVGSGPVLVRWAMAEGQLTAYARYDEAETVAPYTALAAVRQFAEAFRDLLDRADVYTVRLEVSVDGWGLAELTAGDADRARPLDALLSLDPSVLRNRGRLDAESLAAMAARGAGDGLTGVDPARLRGLWHAEVVAGEVRIDLDLSHLPAADTVGLHVEAYGVANRIVAETARHFPEIRRFRIRVGERECVVPREEALTGLYRVQCESFPRGSELRLEVTGPEELGEGRPSPESAAPITVCASDSGATVAVGHLFETLRVGGLVIHVTAVDDRGGATLFVGPEGGRLQGPFPLPPDASRSAAGYTIRNAGLLASP